MCARRESKSYWTRFTSQANRHVRIRRRVGRKSHRIETAAAAEMGGRQALATAALTKTLGTAKSSATGRTILRRPRGNTRLAPRARAAKRYQSALNQLLFVAETR